MQESWLAFIQAFNSDKSYVLASIVSTRGSTYCKTGCLMLIAEDGHCTGLLSGGCLEADISLHAMTIISGTKSKLLRYDLQADAELLWGLGLGCDGALDILLQPLNKTNNYLAFDQVLSSLNERKSGFYCQQINDQKTALSLFIPRQQCDLHSVNDYIASHPKFSSNTDSILVTPVVPPLSLLICGAGVDVLPLAAMAEQLAWQISVWDHRPALLNQSGLKRCSTLTKIRAEQVKAKDMKDFDAVLIMSHNLVSDGLFLKHALADNIEYIGLLGPKERRDKLLQDLSLSVADLQGQLFAPVGLALGGRSPQAIALAICAEIQQQRSIRYNNAEYQPWLIK
jgi:xanthine dehydrogenase accessory factor